MTTEDRKLDVHHEVLVGLGQRRLAGPGGDVAESVYRPGELTSENGSVEDEARSVEREKFR